MESNNYIDLGGTIRAFTPKQTLDRIKPILKHIGITRLANVTGLDHIGIPVFLAIWPTSRLLSNSQGKGISNDLAAVSAAMEAIEKWHAQNLHAPIFFSTAALLSKKNYILSPERFHSSPKSSPVTALENIAWINGIELLSNRKCFLPYDSIGMQTDDHRQYPGKGRLNASTNGLASGNIKEEAILHALYELIERDSASRFEDLSDIEKENRTVNVSSINNEHLNWLLNKLNQAQLSYILEDRTNHEIGVPVYSCILADKNTHSRSFVVKGLGAHLEPTIAMSRAITEAVQSRLTFISASRDDIKPSEYHIDQWHESGRKDLPARKSPAIFLAKRQTEHLNSFHNDLQLVLSLVKNAGYEEVFMCDLTTPEFNIPVVKIICPEMSNYE